MLTDLLGKLTRRKHARAYEIKNRAVRVVSGMVVVAALVAVAGMVPAVRRELRRSFTKSPALFTELYFTRLPFLETVPDGLSVVVPISVVDHGPGPKTYWISVWLAASGKPLAVPATARLDARQNLPATTVVRLRAAPHDGSSVNGAATGLVSCVVFVALVGHPQQLHYRLKSEDVP